MFQHRSLDEIIQQYQSEKIAESEGVNKFYLKPYTTECIQCKTQLNPTFSHRSKAVMSVVRTYKARKWSNRIFRKQPVLLYSHQ